MRLSFELENDLFFRTRECSHKLKRVRQRPKVLLDEMQVHALMVRIWKMVLALFLGSKD